MTKHDDDLPSDIWWRVMVFLFRYTVYIIAAAVAALWMALLL